MNEERPEKYLPQVEEELEDARGVIRIRILKNNRQHNGQKKSTKGQTKIYKAYTQNLRSRNTNPTKTGGERYKWAC